MKLSFVILKRFLSAHSKGVTSHIFLLSFFSFLERVFRGIRAMCGMVKKWCMNSLQILISSSELSLMYGFSAERLFRAPGFKFIAWGMVTFGAYSFAIKGLARRRKKAALFVPMLVLIGTILLIKSSAFQVVKIKLRGVL